MIAAFHKGKDKQTKKGWLPIPSKLSKVFLMS